MRGAQIKEFQRKEPVWMDGASDLVFAFVLEGCIKLIKTHASGRETILLLAGPGDLLCSSAVYLDRSFCCSAIVASPAAAILRLSRERVLAVGDSHPAVLHALMRVAACRTTSLCTRIEEVSSGRVENRLITLLLHLAEKVGSEAEDGSVTIPVALSRRDLADMCATTTETAIRIMRKLEKAGVVQTRSDGFVIPSLEAMGDRSSA